MVNQITKIVCTNVECQLRFEVTNNERLLGAFSTRITMRCERHAVAVVSETIVWRNKGIITRTIAAVGEQLSNVAFGPKLASIDQVPESLAHWLSIDGLRVFCLPELDAKLEGEVKRNGAVTWEDIVQATGSSETPLGGMA